MAAFSPKDIDFIFSSYTGYEQSFLNYLKTVPYNEENKNTWSPEIVSLFLNICGLIESISVGILKQNVNSDEQIDLLDGIKPYSKKFKDLNIDDFEKNIFAPNFLLDSRVVIYIYSEFPNCIIKPYELYREKGAGWWDIYNKLKHNRLDNYEKANLANVIKSLAALFLLISKNKDKDFTLALLRLGMLETTYVPEYAHEARFSQELMWVNSQLFATPDKMLGEDSIDKLFVYNNSKLAKFIGRVNPKE